MKRGHFACLYWLFIVLPVTVNGESSDGEVIRINCGGPAFVDHFNRTWAADSSYFGGLPANSTALGAQLLLQDNLLYATTREWAPTDYVGSYNISVAAHGYFWVRLHFMELTYVNTSDRAFTIMINGLTAYRAYSVANPAVPYVVEFSVPVYGSAVVVSLTAIKAAMHISAIEVARHYPGLYRNNVNTPMMMRTVTRLDMGGDFAPFLDSEGRTWEPDVPLMYFNNRTSSVRVGPAVQVAGTGSSPDFLPLRVLQTATTIAAQNLTGVGLSIVVPVLDKFYHTARLHFAEVQGLTAGQRVMNIYVNNELVYAGLDVVRLAGPSKAMFLDFNMEPVPAATGSSTVTIAVINAPASPVQEPLLSALEVLRHSPLPQVFDPFPDGTLRINCGGEAMVSPAGFPYVADRYFSGGVAVPASLAKFAFMAGEQDNNLALQVAASYREFSGETLNYYRIPVPRPGLYLVRLLFVELEYSNTSERAFTVSFQDTTVLIHFNSADLAIATTKAVHVPVTTPNLTIAFDRGPSGAPYINSIEVYPAPEGQYREALTSPSLLFTLTRINVGGDSIGDSLGRLWSRDNYGSWYSQQRSVVFTTQANISNLNATLDRLPAGIYQSFRKAPGGQPTDPPARLTYSITLVPAAWVLVRLHFAEIELSLPGDRLLDIRINNQLVLEGLDIVRQVGPNAGMHRDFRVQIEDPQGYLVVEVVANARGRVAEPILSAFEILALLEMLPAPPSPPGALHINCGGGAYMNARNVQWTGDAYFEGGTAVAATDNATALLVENTSQDAPVVASYREWPRGSGVGNYVIPVVKGTYLIRMHFAELKYANTSLRPLALVINDDPVGVSYTPSAFASHEQFEYVVAVPGPNLTLSFASVDSTPYINAIEVVPVPAPSYFSTIVAPPAVLFAYGRWNVGGKDVVDSLGRRFYGDDPANYAPPASTAPYSVSNDVVIGGADVGPSYVSAALLRSGRRALPSALNQSSSSSSVPTISMPLRLPAHLVFYLLRLHFCEVEYATAGVRVMDILINGFVAYEKLDVVKEAGASTSLYKDFNVQADGTGLLLVQIRASAASKVQQPMLSAVEMLLHDQLSQPPLPRSDDAAVVRINCGGGVATDSFGRQWLPDRFYSGGQAVPARPSVMAAMYSTVGLNAHLMASQRTWPQDVLGGSYVIPLSQPGLYWVRLYFAEVDPLSLGNTTRAFSVSLDGRVVLGNLSDPTPFSLSLYEFCAHVSGTNLSITLAPLTGQPVINAIEVAAAPAGMYRETYSAPVISVVVKRVNTGGNTLMDSQGRHWLLDDRVTDLNNHTTTLWTTRPVAVRAEAGDYEQSVYQSARISKGATKGGIVVPTSLRKVLTQTLTPGSSFYLVRLHFAELQYLRAGDRVMDILLNGQVVRSGLDLVKEVGPMSATYLDFKVQADTSNAVAYEVRPSNGSRVQEALLCGAELLYSLFETPPLSTKGAIRINCGGQEYTDPAGNLWAADDYFSSGVAVSGSRKNIQRQLSQMETNAELYASYRYWPGGANNSYSIPIESAPGLYLVRVYFGEFEFSSPLLRSYSILLNGFLVVSQLNPPEAGVMYFYEFSLAVPGPNLTITFSRSIGNPMVSALEIVAQPEGLFNQTTTTKDILNLFGPNRKNIGGMPYMDPSGRSWRSDDPTQYTNPNTTTNTALVPIRGTEEAPQFLPLAAYQSERLVREEHLGPDGLSTSIAVSSSNKFIIRLHFAELTVEDVGGRVLDVYINEKLVLSELDVVKEVGPRAALFRDFRVSLGASSSTIRVRIMPSQSSRLQEPKLNALELQEVLPGPEAPPAASKGFSTGAIAGTAVGACVLAAVLLLAAIVWGRRGYNQQGPLDLEGRVLQRKLKAGAVQYIRLAELKWATDNFSDANSMGAGGFGTVYKGQGPNGKAWAVKRANKATQQGFKDFTEEVDLISQLNHVNLVVLLGFCTDKGEQIFVYEFMPNATVDDWLHPKQGSGRPPLTFEQRLMIAVGAARGLSYLHSFAKEPIIHRDVKAANILLDDKLQAKVADFGLLKRLGDGADNLNTARLAGTRGYMDPEYFSTFEVTPKSDVYSFGVVLLELCTGKRPIVKDLENPEETKSLIAWVKWNLSTSGWSSVIDPTMGEFSEQALAHVVELAFDCVKLGAADRPSMAQVVTRLEEIASGEAHLQCMKSLEPLIRRAGYSTGLPSSGLASYPSNGSMGSEAPMLGSEGTSAISVPFVSEVTPR